MGRCLPAPMARPALDRSRSVTNAFAARTACMGAAPFASSAAMADASVHPVPCVLPVLHQVTYALKLGHRPLQRQDMRSGRMSRPSTPSNGSARVQRGTSN